MNYSKQFETFNPLTGDVPDHLFSSLPSIAWRARALLASRTEAQIDSLAKELDWVIEEYFRELRENEILRLEGELFGDDERFETFFEWDGGSRAKGSWFFKDSMESELNIPTAENTSEVEALKDCLDDWSDIGGDEFPNCKAYESFAALSLWLLADAIEWGGRKPSPITATYQNGRMRKTERPPDHLDHLEKTYRLSMAGTFALNAMDAVCHAEHLQEVMRLKEDHFKRELAAQEAEQKKRSIKAEKMLIGRHRNRCEAKDKVEKEWEKATSKFPSAEKAGLYFSDWLHHQGLNDLSEPLYDYQPRAVTNWIRNYAKKIGVRFR